MRRAAAVCGLALSLALAGSPTSADAQIRIVEGQSGDLELTGYLQTVSGAARGSGILDQDWSGLHGAVGRLAWMGRLGEALVVEVHNRFLMNVGTGAGATGIGVTAVPSRAFDFETTLIDSNDTRLWHDLDRLAVTVYTGWADVTVGRQAITWGGASLFPVADLWGRFSPFELDTQQKPGVDAVRALMYPGAGRELDLVVADAGAGESVSAAAQLTTTLGWGDVAVGAGKFWDQAIALAGVTWVRETTNVRLEAAFPWDLDEEAWQAPRITAGVDGLGVRWSWSVELHLNGIGTDDTAEYVSRLQDPAFARGESYFVGRAYAGGLVSWSPDVEGRARLSLAAQANANDGSTAWSPSVSYDLGQASRIAMGGLIGVGGEPVAVPVPGGGALPSLRSEFGSYGRIGFLQLAIFF